MSPSNQKLYQTKESTGSYVYSKCLTDKTSFHVFCCYSCKSDESFSGVLGSELHALLSVNQRITITSGHGALQPSPTRLVVKWDVK